MRRVATTVLLVGLVLGAGCGLPGSSLVDGGPDEESVTPAGVPGAAPESVAYPEGLRPGAIDQRAATRAHREAVANGSYVLTYQRRTVDRTGNDTTVVRSVTRKFRVASPRRYVERIRSGPTADGDGPGRLRSTVFADGWFRYERVGTGPAAVYVRRPVADRDPTARLTGSLLGRYLATGNATVDRRTVDGRAAAVLTIRNVSAGPGIGLVGRVVAVVRPSGLVERLTATLSRPTGEGRRVRTVTFEYDRVPGLTVEPPDWYATARRETGPTGPGDGPGTRAPGGIGIER